MQVEKSLLHASRGPRPIAVVEVQALALEYECADTILRL